MANPGQVGFAVANPLLAKVMPCIQANLDIQIQCLLRQYRKANLHKQIQCLLRQQHSFCRLQGRSLPRYLHGVTAGWCALCGTSPRQRYLRLVCSFSCQGTVTAPQIIPWPPFCLGVYIERLLCYNGDNKNLYFLLSPS